MAYPTEWIDDDEPGFVVNVPLDELRERAQASLRRVKAASRLRRMPRLTVKVTPVENAWARTRAGHITITAPLVHMLDDDELDAITGHEVAHLEKRHGAGLLPPLGLVPGRLPRAMVGALFAGPLLRAKLDELQADRRAAEITGKPKALISALRKLSRDEAVHPGLLDRLGDEHPGTDVRIALLERLETREAQLA